MHWIFTFLFRRRLREVSICCSKYWSSRRLSGSRSPPMKFLHIPHHSVLHNFIKKIFLKEFLSTILFIWSGVGYLIFFSNTSILLLRLGYSRDQHPYAAFEKVNFQNRTCLPSILDVVSPKKKKKCNTIDICSPLSFTQTSSWIRSLKTILKIVGLSPKNLHYKYNKEEASLEKNGACTRTIYM